MMFLKLLSSILLYIVVMTMAYSIDKNAKFKWYNDISYRASNSVIPLHHQLDLTLLPYSSYIAESNVYIYINSALQNITLHLSTYLTIINVKLESVNSGVIYKPKYTYHYGEETLVFNFGDQFELEYKNLKCKIYSLCVKYGKFEFSLGPPADKEISQNLFTNDKGEIRSVFSNLIQPRKARGLFLGFDETKFRTKFDVSISHGRYHVALTNMPIREYEQIHSHEIRTVYQTTPPMSSNDLAFVIFEELDKVFNDSTKENIANIWCRSHLIEDMKFAQYVAGTVMMYLKNKLKILEKQFPKLDVILIPYSGEKAKQTWGLILLNEKDYVYKKELHPLALKNKVMLSVTHDILYQWFGNLLDAPCLSQQWLKEGFLMFLETYIIDKAFPDSRMMDLFVVQIQQEFFHLNVHYSIKHIMDYANRVAETESNCISFPPTIGAVIWRMFENVIPQPAFWKAIEKYFNAQFTYFNTKIPDDIRNMMQAIVNELYPDTQYYNRNIKQIMDIWLIQDNCPELNVIRDYSRSTRRSHVKISKMFRNRVDWNPYFIPVTYTDEMNINFNVTAPNIDNYLTLSNPELDVQLNYFSDWIIVNIQQTGYYRVNYDSENWRRLAQYLNSDKYTNIHVLNRAQIIDDAFYMAMNGKLDISIFWELARYLWREKDYVAWYPMLKVLERMGNAFAYSKDVANSAFFQNVEIVKLFDHIEEEMFDQTIPTKNDFDKRLKQELIKWRCIMDNPLCLKTAKQQLQSYILKNSTEKNKLWHFPEWQNWVYCNGLKTVNKTEFDDLWFTKRVIYQNRFDYRILRYFTCLENPRSMFWYLDYIQDFELALRRQNVKRKERFLAQTAEVYLATIARNFKHSMILEHMLLNYEAKKPKQVSMAAFILVTINSVYSEDHIAQVYEFVKELQNQIDDIFTKAVDKIFKRADKIITELKFFQHMLKNTL